MTPHQKAVNEALWAAIEECSRVEGFMFQQSRTAPCPELAKAYMEQGSGAVQCKRAIEQLLVRVNRGQGLTFNPLPELATIVFLGSNESEPPRQIDNRKRLLVMVSTKSHDFRTATYCIVGNGQHLLSDARAHRSAIWNGASPGSATSILTWAVFTSPSACY